MVCGVCVCVCVFRGREGRWGGVVFVARARVYVPAPQKSKHRRGGMCGCACLPGSGCGAGAGPPPRIPRCARVYVTCKVYVHVHGMARASDKKEYPPPSPTHPTMRPPTTNNHRLLTCAPPRPPAHRPHTPPPPPLHPSASCRPPGPLAASWPPAACGSCILPVLPVLVLVLLAPPAAVRCVAFVWWGGNVRTCERGDRCDYQWCGNGQSSSPL